MFSKSIVDHDNHLLHRRVITVRNQFVDYIVSWIMDAFQEVLDDVFSPKEATSNQ